VRYAKPFLVGASVLMGLRLLLHGCLARYAVPAADDFCYAANAPGTPLFDWLLGEYKNWNGRYFSNVLVGRGPLQWENALFWYRIVPVALLIATWGCLYLLIRSVAPSIKRGMALFAATVVLLLYLDVMPEIGQGIYWYTGAITYQVGNVLLLLLIVQLTRLREAPWRKGSAAAILLVLTIGMSETHMILATFAMIIALAGVRGARTVLIPLIASAFICSAVVLFAPGNAERAAFFPEHHRLWHSLGMTAAQTGRFLLTWAFSPALLTASLAFGAFHSVLREHLPTAVPGWLRNPVIIAALLVMLIVACVFPAYWSMGMLAQHRTLNVACFFFIPLWFWLLHLLLDRIDLRWPVILQRIAMALAMVALLFTGNGWHALQDLRTGRAVHYADVFTAKYADKYFRTCEPFVVPDPPRSLTVFPINGPEDQWMIDCECDYFGLRRAQSDTAN
jgi:hypothetical protein